MTFQDKAKQAACDYWLERSKEIYEDKLHISNQVLTCFEAGALWGRDQTLEDLKLYHGPDRCHDAVVCDEKIIKAKEQGFQEAVEMLRSKAGAEYFADTGDVLTNQGVADWLQEQRNRGEG